MDGRLVTSPFYVRYYPDGRSAFWPPIEAKFATNGATLGRYTVDGSFLISEPREKVIHAYSRATIKGDVMTIVGEESEHYVYKRVVPDLEPGE